MHLAVIVTFLDRFDFIFLKLFYCDQRYCIFLLIYQRFACSLWPTLLLFASSTDFPTTRRAACPLSRRRGDVPVVVSLHFKFRAS